METSMDSVGQGLKILAASFGEYAEISSQNNTVWPIWDQNVRFSGGEKSSMINLRRYWKISIHGNPRTRYASYLDLSLSDGQEHSLTAFCSTHGVCCLQVDDDPKRRLGKSSISSCAITFYLFPNEKIDSIHLVARGSTEHPVTQGPFLTVQTSAGRTLYYGAVLVPSIISARGFVARFDEDGTNLVSGIFSDPMTYFSAQKTLGVVLKARVSQEKTYSAPPFLTIPALAQYQPRRFLSEYLEYTFLTTARFLGAQCLRLQRKGDRCVGISATLKNSQVVILGQWDPSEPETISTIYDGTEGPLMSMTFLFSEGPSHQRYVRRILVNEESTNETQFHWDCLEKSIGWLFTNRSDYFDYWEGFNMEIPVTASALPLIKVAV